MYTLSYIKDPLPFIAICGISGIGKTTIVSKLLLEYPDWFEMPVCFTSRKKRANEVDYYEFVSKDEMLKMFDQGKILVLDEAYGNYYGISSESYLDIIDKGKIPLKDIHPKNIERLKSHVQNMITILVQNKHLTQSSIPFTTRVGREENDCEWVNQFDFDITLNINGLNAQEITSDLIKRIIAYRYHMSKYPHPVLIEKQNKEGYNKMADEFTEDKRITTKNFHDITIGFWDSIIESTHMLQNGSRILELGPGNGWLFNNRNISNAEILGVDISDKMYPSYCKKVFVESSRQLPFQSAFFDYVVSSLADPFLIPEVLLEIERVLKPKGRCILTYPSKEWASNLREPSAINKTTFVRSTGENVNVHSFCEALIDLQSLSAINNLSPIEIKGWPMPLEYSNEISPAITKSIDASKNVQLPIVISIVLEK